MQSKQAAREELPVLLVILYRNQAIYLSSWEPVSWELSWELALKNASKYRILVPKYEICFRHKQKKSGVSARFSRKYAVPDL